MKIMKICVILLISLFVLSGCTNKTNNNLAGYGYGSLFKNVTDDDLKLLGIDRFDVPSKAIKTCNDIGCFKEDFINCNKSQINKEGVIYVIFGYDVDNKCKILVDKTFTSGNSMNCLFDKEYLTSNLFEELIVGNDYDVGNNCKNVNLNQ